MPKTEHQPTQISTSQWYTHTRTWSEDTYFDAEATITPETACASEANPWKITVTLGKTALEPGDHIAIEVHVGWTLDRGRPFVYGRLPLSAKYSPGYQATPAFAFPEGVRHSATVSAPDRMNRYFIIDAVITEGQVRARSSFTICLADPRGSLLCAPWFAQETPVPVAIRKGEDKTYRRLRQIPVVDVRGAAPQLWQVAVTPEAGQDQARVQVTAADGVNLNPSDDCPDPEVLPIGDAGPITLRRESGYRGAPVWRGEIPSTPGTPQRVEVLNRAHGLYGRSNPLVPAMHDGLQVYFGDLHGQSNRSIGMGSEREYFWWARDAELLDFVAPANHYGGREKVDAAIWEATLDLCREFDAPGRFATLFSYEWGGGKNAHRNVYYAEEPGKLFDAHAKEFNEIGNLWQALQAQGLPVITIPHHPKFIGRIDWREHHGLYQRLVEVCSCWGNSEQGGPHSVQTALAMGHRLGVVGGTDTHFSQPGRSAFGPFGKGGVTAILCDKLDRASIWEALYERRCYATTGARILLDFRINGHLMGSRLAANERRTITGSVAGASELASVEIIRNNEVWQAVPVRGTDQSSFEFVDETPFGELAMKPKVPEPGVFSFYYLRVTQKDGHWAMSSPIWLETAEPGDPETGKASPALAANVSLIFGR